MKKILTLLLSFTILASWSQNFSKNSIDGQLFFKIKDSNPIVIRVDNDTRVAQIEDAEFLNDIKQKYHITALYSPFYFKNAPELLRIYRLEFEEYMLVDSIIKELYKLPNIEFAERVPRYKAFFVPNDPLYSSTSYGFNWNWHLDKIKAKEAWDISTGSSSVKVAVVDNAIWYSHPDLSSKIVAKYDAADSDNDPSPPATVTDATQKYYWSHGTHSSGLVGAATNNGIGVASIGYNTSLIAVKTTANSADPMYMTAIAEGIQWAANNGADVISMSFGGPDNSAAYQTFINSLHNAGIVLVAAAGNNGDGGEDATNPNYICYPAANTYVIAVGSTNENDKRSGFSEYGTWLDVSAPGGYSPDETSTNKVNILSTTFCDAYASAGAITGKYDMMMGTSMACPIVAGLCGLMLSVNPSLTPAQLETCLKSSCDNIDALNSGFAGKLGSGRINAQAALQCVGGVSTLTANFSANATTITTGSSVTFTNSSTGGPTSWTWTFTGGTPSLYNGQNPPTIRYNIAGYYNVSLTVSNGTLSDVETKTNYIHVTSSSGIEDNNLDNNFEVFPNPSDGVFNIKMNNIADNNVNIKVLDLTGREIQEKDIIISANNPIAIDLRNCYKGIYFLVIKSNSTKIVRKITIF